MPRIKSYPEHPDRVLAAALPAGLAALFRLAKRRVTSDETVASLFDGIDKMWTNVRNKLREQKKAGIKDLTPLFNNEPNMRKNYLGMVWHSTVPYGNTEFKRVYRWSDGTIGPLNELLNFAGAQLRSLAMTRFPFPRPTYFQIREYPDGTVKTVDRPTAFRYLVAKDVKTRWIAMYLGSRGHPDVRVRHPTLPELDFVDMIRAHMVELCRQCFIHNVPFTASQQYINLLIHRLTPFLERYYSSNEKGRKNFWPDADRELRTIVKNLRTYYGRKVGKRIRPTRQLKDERPSNITVNFLEAQATEALIRDKSAPMKKTTRDLRKLIKENKVTVHDAVRLVDDARRKSGIEGNRWHRVLTNNGYQPNSLTETIFYGDKHHRELNDILIAYEVPVNTSKGQGKADIVVFIRHIFNKTVFWVPMMILDIKTKTGIDWTFYSKKPRTEKKGTRVFSHHIQKRELTDNEWAFVIQSTPTSTNIQQVELYERGILQEFTKVVSMKDIVPESLWKGIIVLDSSQSYEDINDPLTWLIKDTIADLKDVKGSSDKRTVYSYKSTRKDNIPPRLALILSTDLGPTSLLQGSSSISKLTVEKPFTEQVDDERDFILYLTVAPPVSSGESAAWTARNWHLLQYLEQLKAQESDEVKIIWIDLMGDFPTTRFAFSRFRLTDSLSPRGMRGRVLEGKRGLVKEIEFVDLSQECDALSSEETQDVLEKFQDRLSKVFSQDTKHVVIVDGWDKRKQILMNESGPLVSTLERKLIEWLPEKNVEIIWLARPIPLPTRSYTYQRPEVSPLPHNSPRRKLVDMIIWNKPVIPRFQGWQSPMLEYVRVIEKDTRTKTRPEPTLFVVPHLHGWGRRFRAESNEDRTLRDRDVLELIQGPKYARGNVSMNDYSFVFVDPELEKRIFLEASKLSPSILRSRKRVVSEDDVIHHLVKITPHTKFHLTSQEPGSPASSYGIIDRMTLIPFGKPPEGYFPASKITRVRVAKEERMQKESRTTRRPPLIGETSYEMLDTKEIRKDEVLRIRRVAQFLKRKKPLKEFGESGWRDFLIKIIGFCNGCVKSKGGTRNPGEVLNDIKTILVEHKESRNIWRMLSDIRMRSILNPSFPTPVLDVLSKLMERKYDLWARYGNDLYLLILAIYWDEVYERNVSIIHLETLWKAFSDWQLIHMGFNVKEQCENVVRSRYDISYIWDNLLRRIQRLKSGVQPSKVAESRREGLQVYMGDDYHCLVFQEYLGSEDMIAGFTNELESGQFRWRWYECEKNPAKLENWSDVEIEHVTPIVITQSERKGPLARKEILWKAKVDEDGTIVKWWAEGIFDYGPPPEGRSSPIRWFSFKRIDETSVQPDVELDVEKIELNAANSLMELENINDGVIQVMCKVTLDVTKNAYQIQLFEGDEIPKETQPITTLQFENTFEVIQTLRYPIDKGLPYVGKYWWDPRYSVEFAEVETDSGKLSLTFLKPFMYRQRRGSKFLSNLPLPWTAKELLDTVVGEPITLVADPDLTRIKKPKSRLWNILFLQKSLSDKLSSLQDIDVHIFEVAEFFECEQIIDKMTGLRHAIEISINNAMKVSFPKEIYQYDRIALFLYSISIY